MNYFTMAKDLAILIALGAVLYLVYRSGEDRVRAKDLNGLRQEMQEQSNILHGWREVSTHANETLAADVAAINTTPPVQHVWLRAQPVCPKSDMLPGAPIQADGGDTSAGGIQPGSGATAEGSRRDAILDEFKKRWEVKFAEWRAEDAQWPH